MNKLELKSLEALAWHIAEEAHAGKYYAGEPYILHVRRVYHRVDDSTRGRDLVARIAAILHDTVEDTDLTLGEIEQAFGFLVADAVDHLSRRKDEGYVDYIERVKLNHAARVVKACDLIENLGQSYRNGHQSMVNRYERALIQLANV